MHRLRIALTTLALLSACVPQLNQPQPAPVGDEGSVAVSEALTAASALALIEAPPEESAARRATGGSTLDRAIGALGGAARLRQLSGVEYTAEGERFITAEGFFPGQDALNTNHYRTLTQLDLANGQSRQDVTRRMVYLGQPGQAVSFSMTLNQQAGEVIGSESIFGFPAPPLEASGSGAARRELALLNPAGFLRRAVLYPSSVTDLGPTMLGGRLFGQLQVQDADGPVRLYVDFETGALVALTAIESTQLLRDTVTTAVFTWRATANGTLSAVPATAALHTARHWVLWERRDEVRENPTWPASRFAVSSTAPVDADSSRLGALERENHQGFAALSILRTDAPQSLVVPSEVAPGVFALAGGSHNSMLVEQSNGLVLVEAPLNEARSQAILAWAKTRFPSKKVTHVVVTHHHVDHAGGVRTLVAEGARVVLAVTGRTFLKGVLAASSAVVPDALQARHTHATFLTVGQSPVTLADPVRPVVVALAPNGHAQDMVLATLPEQNVLFQSDLWDPGFPPVSNEQGVWENQLLHTIMEVAPATVQIVPGHGMVSTLAQLKQHLGVP